MGTVAGPFCRVPAPVPEHVQPPGAALGLLHPSGAASSHPAAAPYGHPDPGLGFGRTRAPTPPTLLAVGPPASALLRRLRSAGFLRRWRRATVEHHRPGIRDPPRARRPDPRAWAGGSSPPHTYLRRVRTKGPAPSRLKPLGPPRTPQCPRCLLVPGGPPIALLLVHLKGLWARAARNLKGASRNCVSWGTRAACPCGERVRGAKAADHPAKNR